MFKALSAQRAFLAVWIVGLVVLLTASSTARAADATITSPNPDGTQSFNSGDPIVFSGTCDPAPYSGIADLPWRTPSGVPLFTNIGANPKAWSSVEPGDNHFDH
jgi:hypothetical protein